MLYFLYIFLHYVLFLSSAVLKWPLYILYIYFLYDSNYWAWDLLIGEFSFHCLNTKRVSSRENSILSVLTPSLCPSVSPLLQCEDGAAVDGWRRLQDNLLCDEWKPDSVLGLRFSPDPNRRGHPAAGRFLQPRHTGQARLNMAVALGNIKTRACV